jgi:hypothetical protein
MLSGDIARLPRARGLVAWMGAVAAKFGLPAKLKSTNRVEFEQVARDLGLSSAQLYGLLTGRALSADAVEKCLSDLEIASGRIGLRSRPAEQRPVAEQELPFGPFCC